MKEYKIEMPNNNTSNCLPSIDDTTLNLLCQTTDNRKNYKRKSNKATLLSYELDDNFKLKNTIETPLIFKEISGF